MGPPATFRQRSAIVARRLFEPVDISFLVFFRIFFGVILLWHFWEFLAGNLIATLYVEPPFHFTFHGFEWVKPWPGSGMYVHFAALAVFAVFVALGFLYRLSALLLFLGCTYVFLIEKADYLNHTYLMCLLCLLLVFLPAQRSCSVDVFLRPRLRSTVVPAWTLWILRFQLALPYVFGGISKLNGDWLRGQPMQIYLSTGPLRVLFGTLAEEHWLALLFSWGGLFFDLSIVPLLLWRRTHVIAFWLAVAFHLLNAFMFNIGVFPWLMIGASMVFFPADWFRRNFPRAKTQKIAAPSALPPPSRIVRIGTLALLSLYAAVHLFLPFRHWLYPGNVLWTEEGHRFSWQMMLSAKVTRLSFVIVDKTSRGTEQPDFAHWLTPLQLEKMGRDPEMIREFAHFLHGRYRQNGRDHIEVRALVLSSLDGRKPQLLIDPRIDLARQPRTWLHQPYVIDLVEPFRWQPWDVPVSEWRISLAEFDKS